VSPKHSIDDCPICGGGLCGIRICGSPTRADHQEQPIAPDDASHGLIVCDECEAIWLAPDTSTDHQYAEAENAACPVCSEPLWGPQSRWASLDDIQSLGWTSAVDRNLDIDDEEVA